MLNSDQLAKALGVTRPRLSMLIGGYNMANPDKAIKPDDTTKGKRGKPGHLYDESKVEAIRQALGVK